MAIKKWLIAVATLPILLAGCGDKIPEQNADGTVTPPSSISLKNTTKTMKDIQATVVERSRTTETSMNTKEDSTFTLFTHQTPLVAEAKGGRSGGGRSSSRSSSWGSTKSKTTKSHESKSGSTWGTTKSPTKSTTATQKSTKDTDKKTTSKDTDKKTTSKDGNTTFFPVFFSSGSHRDYEVVLEYKDHKVEIEDKTLYRDVAVGDKVAAKLVEHRNNTNKKIVFSYISYPTTTK